MLAFFKLDRLPTPEEIQFYLELELLKDITITDLRSVGSSHLKWGICATGYSSKHLYKVAKSLETSLRMLNVINLVNYNNFNMLQG